MKKLCLLILTLLFVPITAFAAGTASISGPASVENGSNVTVNVIINSTAAWNLKLKGSGSTSGCSNTVADVTADGNNTSKTFSVTCKATSVGTINFTVSGDITSSDGTNSNVSLSKSVSVVAPRVKETESRLSSLSVEGYTISFDKDKTSYSITVEPTVSSINITAKAMSRYSSISGTGSKTIDSEENKFVITCTAENGSKKEYTINVSVKDDNPIIATINKEEYTVYKTRKSLTAPTNYTETTVKIEDFDVPAYTNEITKLTVIGIKDDDGKTLYAIYNDGKYRLYNENKSTGLLLFISEKDIDEYTKTKVTINEKEYTSYEINERFVLVYAMDINTGKENYYKFDKVDSTFQYFEIDEKSNNGLETKSSTLIIILSVISAASLGYILFYTFIKKNKIYKKTHKK